MTIEQAAINEICPLAWKRFQQWCEKPENEKALENVSSIDFRSQVGYYVDFFVGFAKDSKKIRELIQGHCLIEPVDIQKNTVYELFVALERHMKLNETWVQSGVDDD